MPSEAFSCASSHGSDDSLLPDLLHALNQPLSALRCSLELTLLQPRNSEEYRRRLRESLGLTVEIATLTSGIRELLEIEQAQHACQQVAFDRVLRTSVREFLPIADSDGVEVSLLCAPSLVVLGDPEQFSKAVFCLMDFFLSLSCKGDELTIQATAQKKTIETEFLLSRKVEGPEDEGAKKHTAKSYLAFLIGRRVLELSGGRVDLQQDAARVSLRAYIPEAASVVDPEKNPPSREGLASTR